MTPTEKILMIAYGVLSGITIYYIRKFNRMSNVCLIQQESLEYLSGYVDFLEEELNQKHDGNGTESYL